MVRMKIKKVIKFALPILVGFVAFMGFKILVWYIYPDMGLSWITFGSSVVAFVVVIGTYKVINFSEFEDNK